MKTTSSVAIATPLKIVLIGASVRSLIASCLRAGCVPIAFDFFADWDGQQMILQSGYGNASLTKIDRYEDLLELDFASLGDAAILAGGAELRSELVTTVSRQLPLLGTCPNALAEVADPVRWLQVLQKAGCCVPETRTELPAQLRADDWLVKQRATCGGTQVRTIAGSSDGQSDKSYFQKRIAGQSMSAVLVSRRETGDLCGATILLGCTQQWLAADFFEESERVRSESRPYAYRGSLGPIMIAGTVKTQVERVANVLVEEFGLQGVWGFDFILDAKQQVWPVDLNPRITASAELFEAAIFQSTSLFRSVIDLQLSACGLSSPINVAEFGKLAGDRAFCLGAKFCEAKRILIHRGFEALVIDEPKWQQLLALHLASFFQDSQAGISIADVPKLGDRIEAGGPVLTIRSRAKTELAARALLDDLFTSVKRCVGEVG